MKFGKKKLFICIWNVVKLFESVLGKMLGDYYILCWIVKDKLYIDVLGLKILMFFYF